MYWDGFWISDSFQKKKKSLFAAPSLLSRHLLQTGDVQNFTIISERQMVKGISHIVAVTGEQARQVRPQWNSCRTFTKMEMLVLFKQAPGSAVLLLSPFDLKHLYCLETGVRREPFPMFMVSTHLMLPVLCWKQMLCPSLSTSVQILQFRIT